MLPLIQTLFDIALFRKGPEHIPRSRILLVLAIALWLFAVVSQVALIPNIDETDFFYEVFSVLIGITCYTAVVIGFGRAPRLTQTITALLGCGALVTVVFTTFYIVLLATGSKLLMVFMVWSVVLWSVSVKGHIIASAINRHWYFGLAIAVSVFILQHVVHAYISGG